MTLTPLELLAWSGAIFVAWMFLALIVLICSSVYRALRKDTEAYSGVLRRVHKHAREGLDLYDHDARFYLENICQITANALKEKSG